MDEFATLLEIQSETGEERVRSAQAAGRGVKRERNSADLAAPGESVVREFLQIYWLLESDH